MEQCSDTMPGVLGIWVSWSAAGNEALADGGQALAGKGPGNDPEAQTHARPDGLDVGAQACSQASGRCGRAGGIRPGCPRVGS